MTIKLAKILHETQPSINKRISTDSTAISQEGDCCFLIEAYDYKDRSKAFIRTNDAMRRCRIHWDYDKEEPTEGTIIMLDIEDSPVLIKIMDNRIAEWMTEPDSQWS